MNCTDSRLSEDLLWVKQRGPEKITREDKKSWPQMERLMKHLGRRKEMLLGEKWRTRDHWSQVVVWGWAVGGRRSRRTVKASAATVPMTWAVVRGTWSIAYQTPSRAGEQETGRQGSAVILQPHLVSEMSSGKWPETARGSPHRPPPPTELVSTSHPLTQPQRLFTGNDDFKKSSLGPRKPLGKEEQVLRGCKGWG